MQKSQVRVRIIHQLKNSDYDSRDLDWILFQTKSWQLSRVIAVTMSTALELNTRPVIKRAFQERKRVVVPKVFSGHRMRFIRLTPDTVLKRNRWNIQEPVGEKAVPKNEIDLMIVPGLAFTTTGDRLGFGGGYYDRYLKGYRGRTLALVSPLQLFTRPVWRVSSDDVKINYLITERGEIKC